MGTLQEWKERGSVGEEALSRLGGLTDLIVRWNRSVNLTGYRSREDVADRLIGESVAALGAVAVDGREVLDFGSGAGIPGLVWLICVPGMRLTSLESRRKKVFFQKEAARLLGLECTILHGRFPDDVAGRRFDLIVSRAIRFDQRLWERGEGLLTAGGTFVRFAGGHAEALGWEAVRVSERTTVLLRRKERLEDGGGLP
jgi:16S rRNA (guanine527-N7)-methyltransferase